MGGGHEQLCPLQKVGIAFWGGGAEPEMHLRGTFLNRRGERLRVSLFGPLGERFHGHTGHTDCVEEVPSTVQLLARSSTLETQAFKVEGRRFYSSQFHPDLTAAEAQARYLSVAADVGPFESVSEASIRASRWNRARRSGLDATPSGRNFSATSRRSFVSSARQTTPIPPSPIFSTRR